MFHSLRNRLALSHTLPVLLFIPLLGILLLYQLERRYFLDNLAKELAAQGALIATFTRDNPQIWRDPATASIVLRTFQAQIPASIELLDRNATRLATNNTASQPQVDQTAIRPLVQEALQGRVVWSVDRNMSRTENVIDVAVAVVNQQGQVEGAIRLAQRLTDIQARIDAQRWIILFTLLIGVAVAVTLGLLLARSIGAPLLQLTDTVAHFMPGRPPTPVPEVGPDEVKALAATINQMKARLYELERSRKLLLSGIVHELARPLGAIKAAAQTIYQSNDPTLAQEFARGISDHIDRLRVHLDDLALLGELEVQGLHLERTPTDLAALVQEQCALIAPFIAYCQLTLDESGITSVPVLQVDPRRIGQIIGNLLHNACKYTPAGGQITVSCAVTAAEGRLWATVQVKDNGPGIDPAQQSRIFQFFYRSPEQRRIHQGMGIGLALARQLAQAHNGKLTVDSRLGCGAAFTLWLPLIRA
ncbi:MAG: sensor histidine kinase [Caldilinea sp. CFX5]|nr:sensor histidine kinase [Caldilinea sp. CFX5]